MIDYFRFDLDSLSHRFIDWFIGVCLVMLCFTWKYGKVSDPYVKDSLLVCAALLLGHIVCEVVRLVRLRRKMAQESRSKDF